MKKRSMLIACLLGVGVSASVGGTVIYKDIKAQMKQQPISHNGQLMHEEVIVYDNTTYVPIRSFGDITGVPVDYDDGIIYLGTGVATLPTGSGGYIGEAKAKAIALQHAGVQEQDIILTELALESDDSTFVYEVAFYVGNKEYDYEINAVTGHIVSYDYDIEDFEVPPVSNTTDYIGEAKAEQIAFDHSGLKSSQVTQLKTELDEDDGRWEYQVEFKYQEKEYEYEIDAYTGKMIDFSVDHD